MNGSLGIDGPHFVALRLRVERPATTFALATVYAQSRCFAKTLILRYNNRE
jgi:hypothetical protein